MRRLHRALLLAIVMCLGMSGATRAGKPVYVLTAKGTIDQGVSAYVCRGVQQANQDGCAVVLEIDTFGGRLDAAIEARDCLVSAGVPVFTFVTGRAWSAGALMALAGSKMAMVPGSSIGAAEPRPSDSKTVSAMRGEFAATAERFGRDPMIAAAMVDARMEVPDIVDRGEILTLRAGEAQRLGIAQAVVPTREGVLQAFLPEPYSVTVLSMNWGEQVARLLSDPVVGSLLMAAMFIGFLVEVLTPGFGVPGLVALASLALFFGGRLVTGLVGWELIILFVLGFALLLLEAFVIPGFGVAGITGILAVLSSLFLSFPEPHLAVRALGSALALAVIVGLILIRRLGQSGGYLGRVVLTTRQAPEEGYVAAEALPGLVGKEGLTLSALRPSGVVELEGNRLEAASEGALITAGRRVRVVRVEGSRVVVREI